MRLFFMPSCVQGHIHQELSSDVGGVPLFASPSTMAQIRPGAQEYRLDSRRPGYRVVELPESGSKILTRVERLGIEASDRLYTNVGGAHASL